MRKRRARKKLLMVVDAWFPFVGGGQVHVWELSKKLVLLGFDVTILTRDLGRWVQDTNGIKVVRVGMIKNFGNPIGRLEFLFYSVVYLFLHRFDVIHLHAFSPGLLAFFIPMFKSAEKILFTVHGKGVKVAGFGVSAKLLEELVVYKFPYDTEITVASSTLIKSTNAKKTVVIHNGVNLDEFLECQRERNKIKNIVYIGRLSHEKGVDLLIQAHKKIKKKGINLMIVGKGPESVSLKKMISKSDRISFIGQLSNRSDLRNVFLKADLLVLPSRTEGHPLVLFESWASKLPVLLTNVGDNGRFIKDGRNGFICDPNIESLVNGLKKVLKSRTLPEISKKAFREVQRYTWDEVARKTARLYE